MKYKHILLLTVLMVLFITPSALSLTLEQAQEMVHDKTPFTSFQDNKSAADGGSATWTWNYYTDIQTEKMYSEVRKNGSQYSNWKYEIQQSGYNTGYFYLLSIINISGTYYAYVGHTVWNGSQWKTMDAVGNYSIRLSGTPGGVDLVPSLPGDPSEYLNGSLIITEPPYDGYKVSKSKYWLQYRYGVPLDPGGAPTGANITGAGVVAGTHEVHSWYVDEQGTEEAADDMVYKYYRVQLDLAPGINTITATLDYNGGQYSDTATIEYVTGIVDENGDGIDDRTGLPVSDVSELTPDGAPVLPDNATIFDYVKFAVDSIIYVFTQLGLAIKGLIGGIGDVGKILTGFFSFMPQPFSGIIVIGMLIAIILRIFGR